MTRIRNRALLAALLLTSAVYAGPRRRAAAPPPPEAPAEWLAKHAIPLATTEATGNVDDLAPLAAIVGDAHVVGLGDPTHGMHEHFTAKLRIVQFLVQRMGFDVLAMEGSFPQFERINAYVQGGSGDVKQLMLPRNGEQLYWFWDTEEFVAVVEWMRNYNLTRGSKPAIEIVGADMYDGATAANMVVDYLKGIDPAEGAAATDAYTCAHSWVSNEVCSSALSKTRTIAQQIAAKESDDTARTSPRAFADALHLSNLVTQWLSGTGFMRDVAMGDNVAWAKDHRGSAQKVIYWAHNEHVTRGSSVYGVITSFTAGSMLAQKFGSDYVNFGGAAGAGQFLTQSRTGQRLTMPSLTPAGPDDYETFFHASRAPNIVVPLRDPHPFLGSPHHMREGGTGEYSDTAPNGDFLVNLTSRFDAVVFIDQTTANKPFP